MTLLVQFIILNIFNVVIQTVKSIATVKCGKTAAALVNALAYGLYTIVVVYTMCELPLLLKAGIVALCNLVGVFVVKLIEEKARKDKLWKIEATVPASEAYQCAKEAQNLGISRNYICIDNYYIFNFYCSTQKESAKVKEMLKHFTAKYFVSESKIL